MFSTPRVIFKDCFRRCNISCLLYVRWNSHTALFIVLNQLPLHKGSWSLSKY